MSVDYREISKDVRVFVAKNVRDGADENDFVDGNGTTVGRAIISSLALAWADAVREEFQNVISKHPDLVLDMEAAKIMLAASNSIDFVCMPPGMKPLVIMVDQKEMVCFEPNMVYATPLSAIYLNNVREVMDAFKAVNDAKKVETTQTTGMWGKT
jgi:hypothetical protein